MDVLSEKNRLRLSVISLSGISLIVLLIGFIALQYAFRAAKAQLWRNKVETGTRECREFGRLLEQELQSGAPHQLVISHLQNSIANTDVQSEFLCMYDTAGVQICHPDPALIGQRILSGNSLFMAGQQETSVEFSQILHAGEEKSGTRTFPPGKRRSAEIVTVYPVKGSDWILATHANLTVLQEQVSDLYRQYLIVFSGMAILIIASCFLLIRFIYRKYGRSLEAEVNHLNNRLQEITILNNQLAGPGIEKQNGQPEVPAKAEPNRKRFITYLKDEMVLLETPDISLFFLATNTVHVRTYTGKEYTISLSLDEIIQQLDEKQFYRANRQYIVNINAIRTILIYGQNQLRLVTQPEAPGDIIISKNKAADFKKWLDQ